MQNTESFKPLTTAKAIASVEMMAAIVCSTLFWLTVVELTDDVPPAGAAAQNPQSKRLLDNIDLVSEAGKLPPSLLASQNRYEDALEKATLLLKRHPHDVVALICKGNVLVASGNLDDGIKDLKLSTSLAAKNRWVRLNYANKLYQAKKTDEAIKQFQFLIANQPTWVEPRARLASLYLRENNDIEAANALAELLKVDEHNSTARKQRGLALARSGNVAQGLEEYMEGVSEESVGKVPDGLKSMLKDWGQVDRVIFELQQQIAARPDDYVPKLRLAQIYTYGNRPKDAKQLLVEARRHAPTNPEVHRTLAVVMRKLGDTQMAQSEFSLSINLEKMKNQPQH